MPALTGLTRRIALIQGASDALTDALTNRPPRIPRGNGVLMQCAAFLSDPQTSTLIDDWSGIASVTMQVRKDSATGDALFDITVPIGSINTVLTYEQWAARTHQHFTIALTAAQTNQTMPAGKPALPIYIAWQANRIGADPVFLGYTITEIFEDGIGSSGTPTPGDPVYLTAAESRAEFVSRIESSLVLFLAGLTGGGSTKLDGMATVGLSVPRLFTVVIGDQLRTYQLRAGTTAEAAPGIIRPDDYAGGTNEKIFIQL